MFAPTASQPRIHYHSSRRERGCENPFNVGKTRKEQECLGSAPLLWIYLPFEWCSSDKHVFGRRWRKTEFRTGRPSRTPSVRPFMAPTLVSPELAVCDERHLRFTSFFLQGLFGAFAWSSTETSEYCWSSTKTTLRSLTDESGSSHFRANSRGRVELVLCSFTEPKTFSAST